MGLRPRRPQGTSRTYAARTGCLTRTCCPRDGTDGPGRSYWRRVTGEVQPGVKYYAKGGVPRRCHTSHSLTLLRPRTRKAAKLKNSLNFCKKDSKTLSSNELITRLTKRVASATAGPFCSSGAQRSPHNPTQPYGKASQIRKKKRMNTRNS